MTPNLGPLAESAFALSTFGGSGGVIINRWRAEVRRQLGQRIHEVEQLVLEQRPVSELLRLTDRQYGDGSASTDAADLAAEQRAAATIAAFSRVAVLPNWAAARGYLETERETRGRIAISEGVDRLLSTLHPGVHWDPPVLRIDGDPREDVHLDGRGLLLTPSIFLFGQVHPIVDDAADRVPTLVYSVPISRSMASVLSGTPPLSGHSLEALVGHTRAAALQILTESCTTGELSERLGLSLAGASKHATVLRRAGLITTARNRNVGLHTITSLGIALLRLHEADPAESADLFVPGQRRGAD